MSGGNGNGRNGGAARGILWDSDPQVRANIIKAVKAGASTSEACRAAGVSRQTFYSWMNARPDIVDTITRARNVGRARRLRIVQYHARHDWRAAAWMLERENPKRYFPKQRIEHSGRVEGKPLGQELEDDATREALERLGAALDPAGSEQEPGSHSRLPL